MAAVDIGPRGLAAVLTGLRLLQQAEDLSPALNAIYTNGDQLVPLNNDEIDALCEKLNVG